MVGRTDPLCPRHTPQSNMPKSAICLIVTLSCHFHCATHVAPRGYFFVLELNVLLNIVRSIEFAIAL